ncbi:hypothetical protein ACLB2K_074358 [Fragaria x ananassa]
MLHRHVTLPSSTSHHSNTAKWCRCKTTSELQMPVEVNDRRSSDSASVPTHKVTVHDRQSGVVHEFFVSEDQYILHTTEAQDINLPFACRHGCCTSCAVRVKSGKLNQPQALGISAELKSQLSSSTPHIYLFIALCFLYLSTHSYSAIKTCSFLYCSSFQTLSFR